MSEHDGGPAFPAGLAQSPYFEGREPLFPGLSLRDYFAAQVLPAVLQSFMHPAATREGGGPFTEIDAATQAYILADAMLAARKLAGASHD